MSRRNYIHTMDALIGKPFYSNAAGEPIDPNTGLGTASPVFITAEEANNPYAVSMEGIALPSLSQEQIREGATPEVSQAQIDEAKVAQFKAIEEMSKRVASKEANRISEAQRLAQIEAQKLAGLNSPIIIVPPSYVAPPLIMGGGGGGGGGGEATSRPSVGATTVAKPSFLKRNFIPLLLVTGAIFVFIKNPIK